MWNAFVYMPGKEYAYFYGMLAVLILRVAWIKSLDGSTRFRMPSLTKFDPISIAALSGKSEVIRTALFGLWSRNLVSIHGEDEDATLTATGTAKQALHPIESKILKFLGKERKTRDLFQDFEFTEDLKESMEPVERNLVVSNLLREEDHRSRV